MIRRHIFIIITAMIAIYSGYPGHASCNQQPDRLDKMGTRIQNLVTAGDTIGLFNLSDSLAMSLQLSRPDSSYMADIYFYSGVCDLYSTKYGSALTKLGRCIEIKKELNIDDSRYANAIFNAGTASTYLGDYIQVIRYMKEYLNLMISLHGENAGELADAYSALAGASIECLDYEGFVTYSMQALSILDHNSDALDTRGKSSLYNNLGVGYARMGDYAKARLYLEKAESVISENALSPDENYINLINSLAFTYGNLGLTDKESDYFSRGIDLAVDNNSSFAFNLIYNYATSLARADNFEKGERLLSGVVKKAISVYGHRSRSYIEVLNSYASYISEFSKKPETTISIYDTLLTYIGRNGNDMVMKSQILTGYAKMLFKTGDSRKALVVIRDLLLEDEARFSSADILSNPSIDSITVDRSTLRLLQLKYNILWKMYSDDGTLKLLEKAAETGELIISLVDKIRINITEEESRLVLGDNFRVAYMNAIRDFELCYNKTSDFRYLEKAFEYAEKSKVAGLLAATRQMRAVQFHIPVELAEKEKSLQREIAFYNARISLENEKEKPDQTVLAEWNRSLLAAVADRDALILTFEKEYPEYYSLKYNSRVPHLTEIPSILGKRYNYINYVLSDTVLYAFLVNSKYRKLLKINTDSSFMKILVDFRTLLSDPSHSDAARKKFTDYQSIAFSLYNTLISPLENFFSSDNLLISTDNMLSYLPFETFITSLYQGTDIMYRKLDYLMNDYNISYVYSATFMKESLRKRDYGRNNLVAFAPSYSKSLNIDSLFAERQAVNFLLDLPYARQEAEYVSALSNGMLFQNTEAREDKFKSEAGKYSIIHLAMHTVVNDESPMNSAMIFARTQDSVNDGLLRTYEVYGIPLNAKMVVLSSCNTGTGLLSSGEGILSLARGFLFSGSQSVVMSLWKIEDKSGTDIIKMFYDNLRKGMTKSIALRKARNEYLKNSSQLRSHPYFWSALVVYGDNSAVYFPWMQAAIILTALLAVALIIFIYFRKRRYS